MAMGSKSEVPAVLRAVQEARQVLAASCRNHLIRIENEAKHPKPARTWHLTPKHCRPHLRPCSSRCHRTPKPAAWEVEPLRRYNNDDASTTNRG